MLPLSIRLDENLTTCANPRMRTCGAWTVSITSAKKQVAHYAGIVRTAFRNVQDEAKKTKKSRRRTKLFLDSPFSVLLGGGRRGARGVGPTPTKHERARKDMVA